MIRRSPLLGRARDHFDWSLFLVAAVYDGLLGALVGLERQWRQRMAGTRTNALVAAGAAAFVMCGLLLDNDPSARGRIVSYVVSGVGFLGAGVIFKDGGNVRGLNTAATIWCSAAIGALSGCTRPFPSLSRSRRSTKLSFSAELLVRPISGLCCYRPSATCR